MRASIALLALALSACSPFPDRFTAGPAGKLEFRLANGFWEDTFPSPTAIARGGYVILEARAEGPQRSLLARAADPAVVEISPEPVAPGKSDGEFIWRFLVRGAACGRTTVTLVDVDTPLDTVELTVADPAGFIWEPFDDRLEDRRYLDAMLVHPDETIEIEVWAFDAGGGRMAGVQAWTLEAGSTTLRFEPAPDTPQACTWRSLRAGGRAPILVTGKAMGWTEMIFRSPGGAEMIIKATCSWGGK